MEDYESKKNLRDSDMTSDSNWVDSHYFFGNEHSILSEFSWDIQKQSEDIDKDRDKTTSSFIEEFEQIDEFREQQGSGTSFLLPENYSSSSCSTVLAGTIEKSGDASTPTRLVSSSSSEEIQPEKSTGSDGKPPADNKQNTKIKKKGQKRTRQQRFAFMTKSDVDHLEDGYRWRKYGQKAVKNSPYPRSYYRCTNSKCTVKKRVERSCEDPTIVITTYEGQHCHHTVSFPRGGIFSHDIPFGSGLNSSASQLYPQAMQYPVGGQFRGSQLPQPPPPAPQVRPIQVQSEPNVQQTSDEGLLGDMVSPRMRNR
ncbi:WRKY transcription factor 57 [Ranunculus cassubicifolius]